MSQGRIYIGSERLFNLIDCTQLSTSPTLAFGEEYFACNIRQITLTAQTQSGEAGCADLKALVREQGSNRPGARVCEARAAETS